MFIGRTPPYAVFCRLLIVELAVFETELFFFVIERLLNLVGESSSPRTTGLSPRPAYPPVIPKDGFMFYYPRTGLLPIVGELALA